MKHIIFLFFLSFTICCISNKPSIVKDYGNFANPFLHKGQDPWITQEGEYYYYCFSKGGSVYVQKVKKVTDLRMADSINVWTPPKNTMYSKQLWAPELHKIGNHWYIYVAADDGENANHRMHVLVSKGNTVESGFEYGGQITDPENKWAIDGTVFRYQEQLYFIWSGWEGDINVAQHLYIARMESPTKISGNRMLISSPEYDWEKRGSTDELPTINEGPEILERDGKIYLVYSAAGSWSNYYCLGMLVFTGTDPLDAGSWKKRPEPVFEGTECVISPGHCSFITIGDQDWIVYHVNDGIEGGWASRYVKMQPFFWDEDGPVFGVPAEDGVIFPLMEE